MVQRRVIAPFYGHHNHAKCLDDALRRAESACAEQGLRLTALRKQVLELVWQSHAPVRAYDILDHLQERGYRPAPPTAYRALRFLQQVGLVHRIESLNAYVGCADPSQGHTGQFFICERCAAVAEIYDASVTTSLDRNAKRLGFHCNHHTIEIHGVCAACRAAG